MSLRQNPLYVRYMNAFDESKGHTRTCEACQNEQACPDGTPIHERFARLQEAWNKHLTQQQRR
ncbi:hypothetical protein [Streptomyces sp. NPDC057426]|uniref:hypothetical protein n=1 Tax=Streptomyces sp. NPDC057426 TaxID=3346128 RepID=UPI0036CD41A4